MSETIESVTNEAVDPEEPAGRGTDNSRNGTRSKTVLTEIGSIEIEVPRDVDSCSTRRSCASVGAG